MRKHEERRLEQIIVCHLVFDESKHIARPWPVPSRQPFSLLQSSWKTSLRKHASIYTDQGTISTSEKERMRDLLFLALPGHVRIVQRHDLWHELLPWSHLTFNNLSSVIQPSSPIKKEHLKEFSPSLEDWPNAALQKPAKQYLKARVAGAF